MTEYATNTEYGGTAKILSESSDWYWLQREDGQSWPFTASKSNWEKPTPKIGDVWTTNLGIDVRILGVTDTYAVTVHADDIIDGWDAPLNGMGWGWTEMGLTDEAAIVLRALPFSGDWTLKGRLGDV